MKVQADYTHLSDSELLGMLRDGNEFAFAKLYRQYSPQLYLNVYKMVKDEQIAEELVQELFTKVWQKRDELSIESSFLAYLCRVAQNLVYDFFRKLKRDKKMQDHFISVSTTYYEHIEEALHYRESNGILQKALSQLSPQQLKVYQFCKIDGDSYKEVALKMGISPHTVKEYLSNANKIVKSYLLSNSDTSFGLLLYFTFNHYIK